MITYSVSAAKKQLEQLIDEVISSHQPSLIKGKHASAVLVSEEDWSAIQETLYLVSIPGMSESIKEGERVFLSDCEKKLDW